MRSSLEASAGVRVGNTQTPSTTMSVPSEVAWRMALGLGVLGELHHSFALSRLGNSTMTIRPAGSLPSSDLGPAAAGDESAAEGGDRRQDHPPVVLVPDRVFHVDHRDYVGCHVAPSNYIDLGLRSGLLKHDEHDARWHDDFLLSISSCPSWHRGHRVVSADASQLTPLIDYRLLSDCNTSPRPRPSPAPRHPPCRRCSRAP